MIDIEKLYELSKPLGLIMQNFKLVSHKHTPDDQYVKEIACLEFPVTLANNEKTRFRIFYFRKLTKDGQKFWDVAKAGISFNGAKTYIEAAAYDSSFLKDDIIEFLNARSWDNNKVNPLASPSVVDQQSTYGTQPSYDAVKDGEVPF